MTRQRWYAVAAVVWITGGSALGIASGMASEPAADFEFWPRFFVLWAGFIGIAVFVSIFIFLIDKAMDD